MKNITHALIRKAKKSLQIWKDHGFKFFLFCTLTALQKKLEKQIQKKPKAPPSPKDLLAKRFGNLTPIKHLNVPHRPTCINLVTDSMGKDSLFGGVATAVILATLLAKKTGHPLRIITRTAPAHPTHLFDFLKTMQIAPPAKIEFFSDVYRDIEWKPHYLEVSDQDIFLSTSWWSSQVIEPINLRKNFFYILQEVEGFFYPNSDEQWLSQAPLRNPQLHCLINSRLLADYYAKNGPKDLQERSAYFEPAFPAHLFSPGASSFQPKEKHRLFFYARPHHPRNLFYTGLQLIDQAIDRGIIHQNEWDIYFGGSEVPDITFSNGQKPILLKQMGWQEYAQFCPTIDLGICLMNTPHPSYPPLDIAASGGVVLTNQYDNKKSLSYSSNILCAENTPEGLLEALPNAMNLARNPSLRQQNYQNNQISRSWENSLEPILQYMESHL